MVKSKGKKSSNFLLFSDKCLYNKDGSKVQGPNSLCYLYIVIEVLALIAHTVHIFHNKKHFDKISKTRFYIAFIYQILFSVLCILFIYKMCYHCNGWIGIIILLLANIINIYLFRILFPIYSSIDTGLKIKTVSEQLPSQQCNCK